MNRYLEQYLDSKDFIAITEGCINWVSDWFAKNGPSSKAVIGISGGKDSTTVAALCVRALGRDRVLGVMMPDGIQHDIDVSQRVIEHLKIQGVTVNVHAPVEAIKSVVAEGMNCSEFTKQVTVNLPPRIRMATLYAVSQSVGGRVSNNCNRSENYVGYSTIFGDAAGDFSPLANLTVAEIRRIGQCLDLPLEFVEKTPSDGLSGHTDEDSFGFTYEQLDTLILTGYCDSETLRKKIETRHKANLFKLQPMAEYHPEG